MKKTKKFLSAVVCAVTAVCSMSAPLQNVSAESELETAIANSSGVDYDYARALQYSLYFYDANMCGTGVDENSELSWRGDCHTYDSQVPMQPAETDSGYQNGTNLTQEFMDEYKDVLDPDGDGYIDVSGGFHDAGDHVKFGMPENYTAATLGWGYYEFRNSYEKLGVDDHMETILRYFNDYLMKCTFRDDDGTVIAHCYQVGEGNIDHAVWESPEVDSMVRPAWFLTADKPQTDYVVSAAASLAINYLNFKDTDPEYAEKSLDYAKALWQFANDNEKELSDNADGPMQFYSSNKWEDDYCWAAAWMYLATGDSSVFDYAVSIFDYYAASGWAYCWNDVWSGASIMWAVINQEHPELDLVQMIRDAQGKNEYVFDDFWDNDCLGKCLAAYQSKETDGGYAYLDSWGSARYNAAMQLICLVYDKYHNDGKPSEWSDWAHGQMDYLLGDNDVQFLERQRENEEAEAAGEELPWSEDELHGSRCLLVGYNEKSVKYPHHRAASGLLSAEDTREQRHVLWGALAGGFDGTDSHDDYTNNYILNEVTIDYNAAFVGACAGMYEYYGTDEMAVTTNFPPASSESDDGSSNAYWVEACAIDDLHSDGAGVTKVSFKVMTDCTKPSDKISVRYYFDASEISSISNVTGSMLYDQAATEAQAVSTLSGPLKYDAMDNIYYFEIAWDGYTIANSGKKYQFSMGMYYGDNWDPTNDPSYQELTIFDTDSAFFGNGNEVKTDYICVYDDGVLVGGIEPDGTVPATEPTTTTEATTETTTQASETVWGDANVDGEVNISDAVLVMSYVGNSVSYPIEAQGLLNADVNQNGDGISNMDALAVQKFISGSLAELPES